LRPVSISKIGNERERCGRAPSLQAGCTVCTRPRQVIVGDTPGRVGVKYAAASLIGRLMEGLTSLRQVPMRSHVGAYRFAIETVLRAGGILVVAPVDHHLRYAA